MNIYTTDKIRNVVLLGHGGAGKTSLAEAMAYLGGLTSRMGKIADGNTISDYGKEEIKRQFSISTSLNLSLFSDIFFTAFWSSSSSFKLYTFSIILSPCII